MSTPETRAQDIYEERTAAALWQSMVHDCDHVALRGDVMVTARERVCSLTIWTTAGDYQDDHDDVIDAALTAVFGVGCEFGWEPTGYEPGQWLPLLSKTEELERRAASARGEWWVVR